MKEVMAQILILIIDVSVFLVLVAVSIFTLITGLIGKLFVFTRISPLIRIGKYIQRHIALRAIMDLERAGLPIDEVKTKIIMATTMNSKQSKKIEEG